MRPALVEDAAFQHSITAMRKILIEALPSHIISLHGSRSTGLASPLSDVDISVHPKNPWNRLPAEMPSILFDRKESYRYEDSEGTEENT